MYKGDEFYIITYSGNTSRGYCFLDVNNTALSVCGNAQNISTLITAHKGVSKMTTKSY